ncbi:two-component system response regulator LuxO [Caenispirillum salinarum AK4]|uniref:Two-component system response regulator LuxO n=1 Tax=Caenispirillum salinarum AK4 TaxID=1238182 RepID=K9HUR1_9PROT|nr:sigma-54 dependent transcriptional regulator [Caenispirillum salinarum]EKV31996.1 two-component system response regulator LuxO [Caenispirillum salinarum AK4]
MGGKSNTRVLMVEDTLSVARMTEAFLSQAGFDVDHAESGAAGLAALERSLPDAVLLDVRLPDMSGLDILAHIRRQELPVVVVVATAYGSIGMAVEAMQAGADDFLVKPFNADRLKVTLENALERQTLKAQVQELKDDFGRATFHGFIGASLAMQSVYRIIQAAGPTQATVFITGESGTGKELAAEALHKQSKRANGPFVAINCGAIPHGLMESEIFGHVKGAFTGAVSSRDGAARRAEGGTLFLDEICEMEPQLQTKLLRFLQTGTYMRVGGEQVEKADVRIVCATNRDPLKEVEDGNFREDLYYRLHVIPLHLPPLREREGDVVEIARTLLRIDAAREGKGFEGFTAEAEDLLLRYPWPGNVRQLQNVILNAVVLNDGKLMAAEMLPPPVNATGSLPGQVIRATPPHAAAPAPVEPAEAADAAAGGTGPGIKPLWQVEKETIETAIAACDGNIPRAAAALGISASTIYRKKSAWDADSEPGEDIEGPAARTASA